MQVFYRKPISFIFIAVIVSMSFVCRQLYIGTSCASKDCERLTSVSGYNRPSAGLPYSQVLYLENHIVLTLFNPLVVRPLLLPLKATCWDGITGQLILKYWNQYIKFRGFLDPL